MDHIAGILAAFDGRGVDVESAVKHEFDDEGEYNQMMADLNITSPERAAKQLWDLYLVTSGYLTRLEEDIEVLKGKAQPTGDAPTVEQALKGKDEFKKLVSKFPNEKLGVALEHLWQEYNANMADLDRQKGELEETINHLRDALRTPREDTRTLAEIFGIDIDSDDEGPEDETDDYYIVDNYGELKPIDAVRKQWRQSVKFWANYRTQLEQIERLEGSVKQLTYELELTKRYNDISTVDTDDCRRMLAEERQLRKEEDEKSEKEISRLLEEAEQTLDEAYRWVADWLGISGKEGQRIEDTVADALKDMHLHVKATNTQGIYEKVMGMSPKPQLARVYGKSGDRVLKTKWVALELDLERHEFRGVCAITTPRKPTEYRTARISMHNLYPSPVGGDARTNMTDARRGNLASDADIALYNEFMRAHPELLSTS